MEVGSHLRLKALEIWKYLGYPRTLVMNDDKRLDFSCQQEWLYTFAYKSIYICIYWHNMCAYICIYICMYIYMGELWIDAWSLGKKFEAWLLTYRKHVSWRCVYLQKWQWRRNQARQHSQQCLNMGPSMWLSWEIWWSDQPLVFGCPIFRQTRIYIKQKYPISL